MNTVELNHIDLNSIGLNSKVINGIGKSHGGKVKPYIKGHVTDGSSTFTFKVNTDEYVTVPVDANGDWKWVVDRTITSLFRMLCPSTTTYADNIDDLVINANLESCTNFGVAIALTPLTKVVVKNQTAELTDISYFAQDCKDLKEFIAPFLVLGNRSNIGRMFLRCSKLEVVDLRSAEINTVGADSMFMNCEKLKTINVKAIKANFKLTWSPLLTEQSVVNLFNAVTADGITLTFHPTVFAMIEQQLEIEDSPIYEAYWNSEYDFNYASA